jgi:diketogulonate reductase-like aldo/keto reductase
LPSRRIPFQTVLTKTVRQLRQQIPGASNLINSVATKTLSRTNYTPAMAGSSLEKSLNELKTDYVDFFLLHEADYTDTTREDLIAFMELAMQQGKIRSWGYTLGDRLDLQKLIREGGSGRLVQYEFGTDEIYQHALEYKASLKVVYSIMSHRVSVDQDLVRQCLDRIKSYSGFTQIENPRDLLLLYAYSQLNSGVLLLSMTNELHIDKNISIVRGNTLPESETAILRSVFNSMEKTKEYII